MASKVFLKTQFQDGSARRPFAATSSVENILSKEGKIENTFEESLFTKKKNLLLQKMFHN